MPWWSWILLWTALIALSLLFIGVLGVRLFRQFMATLKDLGEAGDRLAAFGAAPSTPGSAVVHVDGLGSDGGAAEGGTPGPVTGPGAAVFAAPALMRQNYHASKAARQEARRIRRIRRKTERGQPQALRDLDIR